VRRTAAPQLVAIPASIQDRALAVDHRGPRDTGLRRSRPGRDHVMRTSCGPPGDQEADRPDPSFLAHSTITIRKATRYRGFVPARGPECRFRREPLLDPAGFCSGTRFPRYRVCANTIRCSGCLRRLLLLTRLPGSRTILRDTDTSPTPHLEELSGDGPGGSARCSTTASRKRAGLTFSTLHQVRSSRAHAVTPLLNKLFAPRPGASDCTPRGRICDQLHRCVHRSGRCEFVSEFASPCRASCSATARTGT